MCEALFFYFYQKTNSFLTSILIRKSDVKNQNEQK